MTVFYCSFCDPEKPKGQQFLGATIVEALDELTAINVAWRLGINPGGEVMFVELEDVKKKEDLPPEAQKYWHRLIPREEVMSEPHRTIDML